MAHQLKNVGVIIHKLSCREKGMMDGMKGELWKIDSSLHLVGVYGLVWEICNDVRKLSEKTSNHCVIIWMALAEVVVV